MEEANFGDYVEVHFGKTIYEGVLLESPEAGICLLKLNNGYNIGFNKKEIVKIKVIDKFKENKKTFEIKRDKTKPNVALIATGGTIVNRYDSKTGAVHPISTPEDLFKFYPEILDKINIAEIEMPFMKASEDMDSKDWKELAKLCEKFLLDGNISGIIITHGTDTLHYTSAALSFFIRNLNKPIVLTYSQRSGDRASSDANLNLQCAALASISDIAEVMLVGHGTSEDDFCYAMPGTKVRKMHSSRRDAFKVINAKPFAKIFPDKIEIISDYTRKNEKAKPFIDTKFEDKIALIQIYPGQDPEILNYYLEKGYKGIVIEGTGLGHVPTSARKSWIKPISHLIKKGITVVMTSQTLYGRVHSHVYTNLRILASTGVIWAEDMLPETAFVKLGWVLGHKEWAKNSGTVKEKMLENFAWEINERLEEE
jgi:glutamyl-tRNA(Gln) amidotransferase subunit D